MFLWRFIDAMPLLAMLALWLSVYSQGNRIGNYSLESLITYYIIGHLISSLIIVHFEEEGVKRVNDGTIATFLLKPYSFINHAMMISISSRIQTILLTIIPVLLLIIIFLNNTILFPNSTQLLALLLFIIIGYILDCLISFSIIATAFFFDQARTLIHLKWILAGIFGGSLLPLNLYPEWMEGISRLLPFQFQFAVPLEIYLGLKTGNEIIIAIISSLIWIGILYVGVNKYWNLALKRFTAVGN